MAINGGRVGKACGIPEEICPAVELCVTGETPLCENAATVDTSDAFGVPRPIEHRQQKLVQNGAITTGTRHNHRQFAFTSLIKFNE